jgi:hypothetical protein
MTIMDHSMLADQFTVRLYVKCEVIIHVFIGHLE